MSYSYFIKLVSKYKFYILIITLLTVVVAELFTAFQAPEYKAVTTWLLEKMEFTKVQSAPVKDNGDKKGKESTTFSITFTRGSTFLEAEILNSEPVKVNLHSISKLPYSYYKFRQNFVVIGDNKPYLTIRFYGKSEDEIEKVISNAKEIFMDSLISPAESFHKKNIESLEEVVEKAKTDFIASKQKLKESESKYRTVDPIITGTTYQQNIKKYQNSINEILQYKEAIEASLNNELKQLKVGSLSEALERSYLASDYNVMETLAELNKEKLKLIELKTKYTNEHKEVIEATGRVEKLKEDLKDFYSNVLKREVTDKDITRLVPFTPLQQQRTAKALHYNIELNSLDTRLNVYKDFLEEEKNRLNQAADYKYELSFLKAFAHFNELKLQLILNFLEAEKMNLGLAKHNYLQHELREVFTKKVKPNFIGNFFYALLFGLLVSFYLILILEKTNPKINDIPYIENKELKILGTVSNTKDLIYSEKLDSVVVKEYTGLKLIFNHLNTNDNKKIISIIPTTQDNSSAIALTNIAYLLANSGLKTLIIDLYLEKPQIYKLFNIDKSSPNLVSMLEHTPDRIEDLILSSEDSANLDLIITTKTQELSKDLILSSKTLTNIFEHAKNNYDYILVNLPNVDDLHHLKVIDLNILLIKINETKKSTLNTLLLDATLSDTDVNHCIVDTSKNVIS